MSKFLVFLITLASTSTVLSQGAPLSCPSNVSVELLETIPSQESSETPTSSAISDGMRNLTADGREDNEFPLAFPGAMGGGKFASGGRGGKVVTVNTRENDCNSSNSLVSLNEALSMTEPRYIVFAVDGIIELASCDSVRPSSMRPLYLNGDNSDVTVACQTAPGKMVIRVSNIQHRNGMSNAIYRHCAIRGARITGGGSRGGQRVMGIYAQNADSENFMFDHLTLTWADDDNFQVFVPNQSNARNAKNITVQHTIVAEGDADSAADTSSTCTSGTAPSCRTRGQSFHAQSGGMAALAPYTTTSYRADNITFTHNLEAHTGYRHYEFKGNVTAEASNNITYNHHNYGATWQIGYKGLPIQVRGNNNLFIDGPETGSIASSNVLYPGCHKIYNNKCPMLLTAAPGNQSGSDIGDNYYQSTVGGSPESAKLMPDHPTENTGNFTGGNVLTTVVENTNIRTLAAEGSAHMNCIGASNPVRHAHDQRIIGEMYAGTGNIGIGQDIRSYTSVINASTHDTVLQRDWSEYQNGPGHPSSYDTDEDGMSDEWELANSLDVGAQDHNGDIDSDGYTNIEEFLNYMARCPE